MRRPGSVFGYEPFNAHRYAYPIKCTEVILAEDNETVVEIRAEYDPLKKTKPKVILFLTFFSVILEFDVDKRFVFGCKICSLFSP